jgi:hypothetical protein
MFWVFQGQHLERNDNTNILLSQFTHPLSKFIYPLFPFCNSLSRFQKPLSRFVISVSWLQIMRYIFVNSPCMLAIIISTKQCLILGFYQKIGRSKKNEKKKKKKNPSKSHRLKRKTVFGEVKRNSLLGWLNYVHLEENMISFKSVEKTDKTNKIMWGWLFV